MPNIRKTFIIFITNIYLFVSLAIAPIQALAAPNLPPANPETSTETSTTDSNPSTWYNQGFTGWYSKVYGEESPPDEIFGERYTAAQVQWIIYSLFSFPVNMFGDRVQRVTACIFGSPGIGLSELACIKDVMLIFDDIGKVLGISITNKTGYIESSPSLGFWGSVTKDYQSRPLSGIKYTINTISRLTSIPTVNAQGFGYNAVDGLQKYWQGFRDIAYALSVLVVIIFAFMIMFRVKLSPQLVISVQSALPKVFIALILATFSYAIAGFVIDLSYVVGGLFASLVTLAGFSETHAAATAIPPQITGFQEAFLRIVPIERTDELGGFYILIWMIFYTVGFFIAAFLSLAGTIVGFSVYGVVASLLTILMTVWVFILAIVYTITVPFKLLKNLISLLLSIVVAPVQIVIGAIVPSIGFTVWFRKIVAEALVFPLVGLFMYLAAKMLKASIVASFGRAGQLLNSTPNQNLWAPPILGSSADMAGILWLAVSFTFITMIPKAVDIMKMLVMGAKFDFGTAMGEAVTPFKMAGLYTASQMSDGKTPALVSSLIGFFNKGKDLKIEATKAVGEVGKSLLR